jgi:glycosyltransferase involved in cell wall biosynthesis
VSHDIIEASKQTDRKNWVVYAGTHTRNKGIEQLIAAWSGVNLADWELHLFGKGEITSALEKRAEGNKSIIFHGLLDRRDYAKLLGQARIGINPHSVSQTPGNIFAFKIVEYIGAGLHCITTPMGALEPEIEAGLTYMPDNSPATIAATLQQVIKDHCYKRLAVETILNTYGPEAVARSLDGLLQTVMAARPVKSGA